MVPLFWVHIVTVNLAEVVRLKVLSAQQAYMADFNLVEPRGWDYDLQSVILTVLPTPSLKELMVPNIERSTLHTSGTFKHTTSHGWWLA